MSQITPESAPREPYDPYEPYDPGPIRHEPRFRLLRKLAAPLIVVGAFLAKFKFILFAIFKFKVVTTSLSMVLSIGAYSLLWGWKFALGFVALLFVHEAGHALEAKRTLVHDHAIEGFDLIAAIHAGKLRQFGWRR